MLRFLGLFQVVEGPGLSGKLLGSTAGLVSAGIRADPRS